MVGGDGWVDVVAGGPIWPWFGPTVDVDVDVVGVVGGCGGFFSLSLSLSLSAVVCGGSGSGWWLVVAMVGGCGGCGMGGWVDVVAGGAENNWVEKERDRGERGKIIKKQYLNEMVNKIEFLI